MCESLENMILESLQGKGLAYIIDSRFILYYAVRLFLIYFLLYLLIKRRKFSAREFFPRYLFAWYMVVIICFTLLPISIPAINSTDVNFNFSLLPLLNMFTDRSALINTAGNVMLFIPVVILGRLGKFRIFCKVSSTLAFSLAFSLAIEGMQYLLVSNGYADMPGTVAVDIIDVLTNTTGGVTGWFIVEFYRKTRTG